MVRSKVDNGKRKNHSSEPIRADRMVPNRNRRFSRLGRTWGGYRPRADADVAGERRPPPERRPAVLREAIGHKVAKISTQVAYSSPAAVRVWIHHKKCFFDRLVPLRLTGGLATCFLG